MFNWLFRTSILSALAYKGGESVGKSIGNTQSGLAPESDLAWSLLIPLWVVPLGFIVSWGVVYAFALVPGLHYVIRSNAHHQGMFWLLVWLLFLCGPQVLWFMAWRRGVRYGWFNNGLVGLCDLIAIVIVVTQIGLHGGRGLLLNAWNIIGIVVSFGFLICVLVGVGYVGWWFIRALFAKPR